MPNIVHASISEKGTINGTAGDQTGKEVCKRSYYNKPWDYVAIHPDPDIRGAHAEAAKEAAENNCIGYSQYGSVDRNSLYKEAKKVGFILKNIKTKCNCDCSSLQHVLCICTGAAKESSYGSNGWTTSTMKAKLKKLGYVIITDKTYMGASYCVEGAIYVKEGSHTVCAIDNGSNYRKTLSKAGADDDGGTYTGTIPALCPRGYYKLGDGYQTLRNYPTQIKRIQMLMNWAVDAVLKIDGDYGPKTVAAVKKFQKKVGISVDGQFGKDTLKKAKSYRK